MESTNQVQYLTKPNIKGDSLPYKQKTCQLYVNLFKFEMTKEIKLYQYPFTVQPEIGEGDYKIRNKLFKYCGIGKKEKKIKLKDIYGECFISGDSLYAMKEIKEEKTMECTLFHIGQTNYTITFQPKIKERRIKQEDLEKDPLTKQFIEMLIRDILHSNPKFEFYKGLFVYKDKENEENEEDEENERNKINENKDKENNVQNIESEENGSINFYPGYTTSFMETEGGNYINVTLKNKISSADNILKFLKYSNYKAKENHAYIIKNLVGKKFNVSYSKRNYVIDEINFGKNPKNQTFNYEKRTITLKEYYSIRYDIKIKDLTQPLIVVHRKDEKGENRNLHFIPELCYLSGLDDKFVKDRDFMKKLSFYTKLTPEKRIEKTNQFVNLFKDQTEDEENKDKLSAYKKSKFYGIKITSLDELHKGYYMKQSVLIGGDEEDQKKEKKVKKGKKVKKPIDLNVLKKNIKRDKMVMYL